MLKYLAQQKATARRAAPDKTKSNPPTANDHRPPPARAGESDLNLLTVARAPYCAARGLAKRGRIQVGANSLLAVAASRSETLFWFLAEHYKLETKLCLKARPLDGVNDQPTGRVDGIDKGKAGPRMRLRPSLVRCRDYPCRLPGARGTRCALAPRQRWCWLLTLFFDWFWVCYGCYGWLRMKKGDV